MLDHFGFVVKDLNKVAIFYENILSCIGLKVIERHDYGSDGRTHQRIYRWCCSLS